MITLSKLKEYEDYGGYYDGFYIQKVQKGTNITTDKDWSLIKRLIHDAWLVRKELASAEFIEKFHKELFQFCDIEETRGQLKLLAEKGAF
jgi:hypothetical protein